MGVADILAFADDLNVVLFGVVSPTIILSGGVSDAGGDFASSTASWNTWLSSRSTSSSSPSSSSTTKSRSVSLSSSFVNETIVLSSVRAFFSSVPITLPSNKSEKMVRYHNI